MSSVDNIGLQKQQNDDEEDPDTDSSYIDIWVRGDISTSVLREKLNLDADFSEETYCKNNGDKK